MSKKQKYWLNPVNWLFILMILPMYIVRFVLNGIFRAFDVLTKGEYDNEYL